MKINRLLSKSILCGFNTLEELIVKVFYKSPQHSLRGLSNKQTNNMQAALTWSVEIPAGMQYKKAIHILLDDGLITFLVI